MLRDYGFDSDEMNKLYDEYYHGVEGETPAVPTHDEEKEPPFITSEEQFMDWDANAGFPIWLDTETIVFLFSIRYSSPAFTGTYLQEDYRIATHREFSSLIRDIIQQKIQAMRMNPSLYDNAGNTGTDRDIDEDLIDRNNVIEIASSLGIDAASIDVYTVVADVAESLEIMLGKLIKWHPHMTPADKKYAIDFMDGQLWDDADKQLWRDVSAEEMARLFDYRMIPRGAKVIEALNEYVQDEFAHGAFQASEVASTDLSTVLNDNVVEAVLDALEDNDNAPDDERTEESWIIQDAIIGAIQGEEEWA